MNISKKQYEYLLFFALILLAVFRFSYLGLRYTPYLDDYVQYSYYPNLENNWQRVYLGGAGVLFTRPLAGLFDFLIWSRFWESLGVAVALISVLHGLSAIIFLKSLNMCGLRVGHLFLVVYVLLPINSEATYWLSASSRIVVSMFFVSLMMYFGARKKILLFCIFNFLSMWFYEQTAVLAFFTAIFVCVHNKWRWQMVFPIIFASLVIWFYFKFGTQGDNAKRILQAEPYSAFWSAGSIIKEFFYILTNVEAKIIANGLLRGLDAIIIDGSFLWLLCLIFLGVLFFLFSKKSENPKKPKASNAALGAIFMIVPLAPFFLLGAAGFNLRNIAPSLLGFAILSDAAGFWLFKNRTVILSAILIFLFSVASVSELLDYTYIANQDFKIASEISAGLSMDEKTVKVRVKAAKDYPQNAPYRDHIISMRNSDWGMTGIVRAISKNEKVIVEMIK